MNQIKRILLSLALTLLLGACSSSMNFMTSPVVPATTGKINVKCDKNDNYLVRVNVQNLAPPDRPTPA